MGLTVPLALLGLALAGIPVLAHLVRRSDVPTRTLPTVALLARALAQSRRRVRVVDPGLLAVRVALVIALALAVAAPFLERQVAYGTGGLASVVVVVDDSMSMARAEGETTLFEAARTRARVAIDALPEGSEVAVVMAGRPARILVGRTLERARASEALDALEGPGARSTDVEGAIGLATRQLSGAAHSDRRILVLSDLATREPVTTSAPSGVRIDLEALGPTATPNVALASVEAVPDPTIEGSLSVAVVVRALGMERGSVTVAIVSGDRELARADVPLVDGAGRAMVHVLPPDATVTSARAQVLDAGDALPMDDARWFLLRPSSSPRVLLVDGDPRPLSRRGVGTGGSSTRFLAQALALAPADGPRFVVRRTDVEAFVADREGADVIALADVDLGREDVARRVRDAVTAGAGLLVAGGDHVSGGAGPLGDLLPARIVGARDGAHVGLRVGAQPLRTRDEGLSHVTVSHALVLEPADAGTVALQLDDGSAALVLDRHARRAVLGVALDDTGSDLPLHPGFVALAIELFRALAPEGTMPDEALAPDALPPLVVPSGTDRVDVVTPSGALVSFESGLDAAIDLGGLAAPGAYEVRVTDASGTRALSRAAFVIAPSLDESRLERPVATDSEATSPTAAPRASRVRTRLAPWVFALAGLLALAEAMMRRPQRSTASRASRA